MQIHLKIVGGILVLLAVIHVIFPKYFQWKEDLGSMSLINKQVMQAHTFFIAFTVLLMGTLCLIHSQELVTTVLGKNICFGLGIFWGIRFLFQQFFYSPKLWKGKTFETLVHVLFTCLWLYFTVVFVLTYFR